MRPIARPVLAALSWLAVTSATVPAPVPGDVALARAARSESPETSALERARWHQIRGEFPQALEAFERAAAARGAHRAEALHGAGSCRLAMGETEAARAAFRELARTESDWRAVAELAIGFAHERDGRLDRASEHFARAKGATAGEAGPAALERFAALAERAGRTDDARAARAALRQRYPKSFEAARLAAAGAR